MSFAKAFLRFLSTPSARRATSNSGIRLRLRNISIHALREEGDTTVFSICQEVFYFYPRPPRGGRRIGYYADYKSKDDFYPRPPRGGRRSSTITAKLPSYFYPRPPRGGRPESAMRETMDKEISIHALREEGDTEGEDFCSILSDFYPRPPRGGRQRRHYRE